MRISDWSSDVCSSDLLALATQEGAAEIIVALRDRRSRLPIDELLACRLHGIQVTQFATFMERETGRVELEALNPSWLIFSDGFSAALRLQRVLKRGFDVVTSLLVLGFTLPVSAIAALAIFSCDRGPIFYRQDRVGQHGRIFPLLKFRSMRVDAERDGVARWAAQADSRITPVGGFLRRTRIDERSEEHTSELQSLMRTSYAGFCLKKKNIDQNNVRNPVKTTPAAGTSIGGINSTGERKNARQHRQETLKIDSDCQRACDLRCIAVESCRACIAQHKTTDTIQ